MFSVENAAARRGFRHRHPCSAQSLQDSETPSTAGPPDANAVLRNHPVARPMREYAEEKESAEQEESAEQQQALRDLLCTMQHELDKITQEFESRSPNRPAASTILQEMNILLGGLLWHKEHRRCRALLDVMCAQCFFSCQHPMNNQLYSRGRYACCCAFGTLYGVSDNSYKVCIILQTTVCIFCPC